MRSLARDFSSSRRAPPNAASKPYFAQPVQQRPRLQEAAALLRAELERDWRRPRSPPRSGGRAVRPRSTAGYWSRNSIISRNLKLVSMCSRGKGNRAGIERLLRQPQHHGRVFADGIQHHRLRELGSHFADDVDAFRFEGAQVSQGAGTDGFGYCAHANSGTSSRIPCESGRSLSG